MNEREFCYWLQGFFEISDSVGYINPTQTKIIQDHLNLEFNKVTPTKSTSTGSNTASSGWTSTCGITGIMGNSHPEYYSRSPFDFIPSEEKGYRHSTGVDEIGYQKLFTGHTGITAAGFC